MTHLHPTIRRDQTDHLVVRAPRKTDAIGQSLRGAFDRDSGIPDEFMSLLRELDTMSPRPH